MGQPKSEGGRQGDRRSAGPAPRFAPERQLGAAALGFLALLAVPLAAAAAWHAGAPGAVAALAGVGLVAILFGVSAAVQAWGATHKASALRAVTWLGFVFRLGLYLAVLSALGTVGWLHRPSLAVATAVAFTATLIYEIRLVQRVPGLFWVRVTPPDVQRGVPADATAGGVST